MTSAAPDVRVHRRSPVPVLLAAAAVLVLGWLVSPSPVPLYDGVGMPDEPYRFVVPPPKYRSTPPVTEARSVTRLNSGRSCCELEARSGEQGPQVTVYIPRGGLAAPGSGDATVLATPIAAPTSGVPLSGGHFEGNLYRVSISSVQGPGQLTPEAAHATLQLRALNGDAPSPAVWYRGTEQEPWRMLSTGKSGFDILESQFVGPGDYILVRKGGSGSGSTLTVLLGILAIPAILVVALVILRLRGGPDDDDEDEDEDEDAGPA